MLTIQKTSDSASVTSAAAVVLIVPDPARRASVARMLAGLNVPVVRECTTYPDSRYLDELMALDGDVFVVDLDGDVEQALSLIEAGAIDLEAELIGPGDAHGIADVGEDYPAGNRVESVGPGRAHMQEQVYLGRSEGLA